MSAQPHSHLAGDPGPLGIYSDEAKRIHDAVNLHLAAIGEEAVGQWVAFALADGRSDGVLYRTREDAIRHQKDASRCGYVRVFPDGIAYREAQVLLEFNRKLYDSGYRPDAPSAPYIHMPQDMSLAEIRRYSR